MAFSGLPSKACANCRLRRIKCNLVEPECAQCRRAGRVCPGYRDHLALLFRDENSKVIRKVHGRPVTTLAKESKRIKKEDAYTYNLDTPQSTTPSELQKLSITSSPAIDIFRNQLVTTAGDAGISFFFDKYMTMPMPLSIGQLDMSSMQIWHGVSEYEPFRDAISCVGLAGLSNVKNDPEMMKLARLKYAATLRRVMTSLQVPGSTDMGYTLKAVMMLALFEMINCDSPGAALWGVHLDGIAALLNSAGFLSFQDKLGMRIKHQFFFAMFIKYVQSGQKVPTTMAKWCHAWGASFPYEHAPAAPLSEIIIKFVNLYASVRQGEATNPTMVVQDALLLDKALEDWEATLPPTWKYKVLQSSQLLGTYDGQYHVYSNYWIARMWNHYRWSRILVHELILTHIVLLPMLTADTYNQQKLSLSLISQHASSICASTASQLYRTSTAAPNPSPNAQLIGVFILLWPLKIAGSAIGVSEALHEWVLNVLEDIGRKMGIRQTKVVMFASIIQRECWKTNRAWVCEDNFYT